MTETRVTTSILTIGGGDVILDRRVKGRREHSDQSRYLGVWRFGHDLFTPKNAASLQMKHV
ncbi:hypothetical protein EGJ27_10665 [Pseudomonas sp. v388]|nr:hypothetical protein EGJ27_10665 [Pseudomonas sp. v388]